MSLGAEELEEYVDNALGDYLMLSEGQYIVLRGKYRGKSLDQVPRGYVREYILNAWKETLSEEEFQLFSQRARKPEETGARTDRDQ